jgi:hypothetical protein
MEILQSHLEEAKNTGDTAWLQETFRRAHQVVAEGGTVQIMQEFSDARREVVGIIDRPEQVEHLEQKYSW